MSSIQPGRHHLTDARRGRHRDSRTSAPPGQPFTDRRRLAPPTGGPECAGRPSLDGDLLAVRGATAAAGRLPDRDGRCRDPVGQRPGGQRPQRYFNSARAVPGSGTCADPKDRAASSRASPVVGCDQQDGSRGRGAGVQAACSAALSPSAAPGQSTACTQAALSFPLGCPICFAVLRPSPALSRCPAAGGLTRTSSGGGAAEATAR